MYRGVEIITSEAALKDSDVRLFPASRHRSARVHKKLLRRFGGEFKKMPAVYRMGDRLIVHPTLYHQLLSSGMIGTRP